jgi:hypothetical protein
MGSKGVKPRKRPRPGGPAGGNGAGADGGWELEHSPYTFEGQIEGLSRFGRGVSSASPRMRMVAIAVAATFVLPFVVWIWSWLMD